MKNLVLQLIVLPTLFFSYLGEDPQDSTTAEVKTVTFAKSGEVILNPGQGWMLYGLPVSHNDATIALGTTGYHRFRWYNINPQEDVYDWTDIDNHLSRWAALGKQFALGINTILTPESVETNIPQWVFDKGMKSDTAKYTNSSSTRDIYIPVWDDPVFLGALRKFVAAFAARYDGDERIAFIDIRIYGLWGELHWDNVSNYTTRLNDAQVANLHQIYPDNFKKTKLVQNFPQNPLTRGLNRWAVDNGIGLRGDGIMGPIQWGSTSGTTLTEAIGKEVVAWEWWGQLREYLGPDPKYVWDEERFVRIIKENKPNYIGMGKWGDDAQYMTNHKPELAKMVANLMGYHFAMTSAKYTNLLKPGEAKEITVTIENAGVTTMLTNCAIKLALLDENDEVVSSFTTDWDAKTFEAGKTTELSADVRFTGAPAGAYKLAIGLFLHNNDQTPTYKMDNKDKTNNGFYIIGDVRVADDITPVRIVTFDSQTGSAVASQNVADNGLVTFPANPTLAGHIFDGWYKEAACTNVWNFTTDAVTANVTLYAKWLPASVVTFNTHSGGAMAPQTVPTGSLFAAPITPTRSGYTFNGWYTAATGGAPISFPLNITTDITLHAQWTVASTPPPPGGGSGSESGDDDVTNDAIGSSSFRAYPNPTDGIVTVIGLTEGSILRLYSVIGTQVGVYTASATEMSIDLSHLAAGMYLLNVDGRTLRVVRK